MPGDADAIVVGSGPNGLAAAVTLAAAGLRVHVIALRDVFGIRERPDLGTLRPCPATGTRSPR